MHVKLVKYNTVITGMTCHIYTKQQVRSARMGNRSVFSAMSCNVTRLLGCGKHGRCEPMGDGFACICDSYWNWETNCTVLYSEVTGTADIILNAVLMVLFAAITIAMICELVLDIRFRRIKLTWTNTMLFVKGSLLSGCLLGLAWRAMEIRQFATSKPLPESVVSVVRMLLEIIMTPIYIFALVNWISLLLRVQSLDASMHGIQTTRRVLFGALFVFMPLYLIAGVLILLDVGMPLMQTLFQTAATILFVVLGLISGYYLIRALVFTRSRIGDSAAMSRAYTKTIYLLIICVSYWAMLVAVVLAIALARKTPWVNFATRAFSLAVIVGIYTGTYLFASNFGPRAYWNLVRGHSVNTPITTTTRTSTNNTPVGSSTTSTMIIE